MPLSHQVQPTIVVTISEKASRDAKGGDHNHLHPGSEAQQEVCSLQQILPRQWKVQQKTGLGFGKLTSQSDENLKTSHKKKLLDVLGELGLNFQVGKLQGSPNLLMRF